MCVRGVRSEPVPQPADPIRQTLAPTSLPPHGQRTGHRAALLRQVSRKNPD